MAIATAPPPSPTYAPPGPTHTGSLRRWAARYAISAALASLAANLILVVLAMTVSVVASGQPESVVGMPIFVILVAVYGGIFGGPIALITSAISATLLYAAPSLRHNPGQLRQAYYIAAIVLGATPGSILAVTASADGAPVVGAIVLGAVIATSVAVAQFVDGAIGSPPAA